jgi:hypothetical protein
MSSSGPETASYHGLWLSCPWEKNGNLTTYLEDEDEDATLTFVRRFEVVSRFFCYMSTHADRNVSWGVSRLAFNIVRVRLGTLDQEL